MGEGHIFGASKPIAQLYKRTYRQYGSSIHNTRSEHLWVDLVNDLSTKWKKYFQDLETHHGLNAEDGDHMWLLHYLFLGELNSKLQEWAKGWNHHKMQLRGEMNKSPMEMFLIGMVEQETPGVCEWIEHQEEDIDNLPNYGVDWEDLGDEPGHHLEQGEGPQGPFDIDRRPDELHEVACDGPDCPLSATEKGRLDAALAEEFGTNHYRSMPERMLIWNRGLELCRAFVQQRGEAPM